MSKLLFVVMITIISNVYANTREIVWQSEKIRQLRQNFISNPIFLKRIFTNRQIERTRLGRATGPYYHQGNHFYKDFQDYTGACYQVLILEDSSYAKKIKCFDHKYQLTYNNITYAQIDDVDNMEDYSFEINQAGTQAELIASHFTRYMIDTDDQDFPKPHTKISVELTQERNFQIHKGSLSLITSVTAKRSAYTYLPARSTPVVQKLKLEPKLGDFIFKNGHTFALFKRYQHRPLSFKLLELSTDYPEYLANIDKFLFQFPNDKRCLRDSYPTQSPNDCDYLIFKKKPYAVYTDFSLIIVNTANQTVRRVN